MDSLSEGNICKELKRRKEQKADDKILAEKEGI